MERPVREHKNAGYVTVTVTGKGAYTGTITSGFTIKPLNIKKATFSSIKSQKYTGYYVTPKVTVKYKSKKLKLNTDYRVSYQNSWSRGKAKAIISEYGNYQGSKTLTFTIK